jgi:capsular exopolysaccharide synthesis family protein
MSRVIRQEPNDISLRDVFDLFRRQKVLIWGCLALAVVVAAVYCSVTPPIYRSNVKLLVEGRTQTNPEPAFGDPLNQVTSDAPPAYDLPTIIEMFQSGVKDQVDRDLIEFSTGAHGCQILDVETAAARARDLEQMPQSDRVRAQKSRIVLDNDLPAMPDDLAGFIEDLRKFQLAGGLDYLATHFTETQTEKDQGQTKDKSDGKPKEPVTKLGEFISRTHVNQVTLPITLAAPLTSRDQPAIPVLITAEQVGPTNVLQVNADSPDKRLSILYASLVQQGFSEYLYYARQKQVQAARSDMEANLAQLETQLKEAQGRLVAYQNKNNTMEADIERQVRTENTTRSEVESEVSQKELEASKQRLDAAIAARSALNPSQDSVSTKSNTENIEAQKKVIADLVAQRETLLAVYQPASKEVKKIDAQIAKETDFLNHMPKDLKVVQKIRNPMIDTYDAQVTQAKMEYQAAIAGAANMGKWAKSKQTELHDFNTSLNEQLALQRDVDDAQASVTELKKNLAELIDRAKGVRDPAVVLQDATAAQQVKPNWPKNMALAILVGLVMGVALAVLRDRGSDRAVSVSEIDDLVGALPLGYIPALPRKTLQSITPNGSIDVDVKALPGRTMTVPEVALESYRILRANFNYSTEDQPVRSILVTSTNPGEGKSTVASNLAIAMAADGKRVILVDANLRRPSLHKIFKVQDSPGLADVLLGRGTLGDVLQATTVAGVSVITAGMETFSGSELFGSPTMKEFHSEILENCDIAIFDGAQCARVADAQVMSSVVEGVLFVVQPGVPKKTSMQFGIGLLRRANAHILGIVYNRLSVNEDNAPRV